MPLTKSVPSDTDITVTTATAGEAEVRAALGEKAETPVDGKKAVEAAPIAATEGESDDDVDGAKPDAEASEAGRTLRRNRTAERVTRLQSDIELYEDNIRRLGGTVTAFEKKTYDNPQAEIDAFSKRRNALLVDFNKILKNPPARREEPPARRPAAAAPAKPAEATAPTFEFPTFEAWQAKHPEADYTVYADARTDARFAFNRDQDAATAATAAAERASVEAVTNFKSAVDTFKVDHDDYDARTSAISLAQYEGLPTLAAFQRSLLREGKNGPPILYYVAQHTDELHSLLTARTPAEFLESFGVLKHVVRSATAQPASAAAAVSAEPARPAAPAKPAASPKTSAPAPLETVRGSATTTRTLQSIADDDEDADAYIEARRRRK